MMCAKLELQERLKSPFKPRMTECMRLCQRRMVDPGNQGDMKWAQNIAEKFYCKSQNEVLSPIEDINQTNQLYLSVQTLKFKGKEKIVPRPRTSSKLKSKTESIHRMFVDKYEDNDIGQEDSDDSYDGIILNEYIENLLNENPAKCEASNSGLHTINKPSQTEKETEVPDPKAVTHKENNNNRIRKKKEKSDESEIDQETNVIYSELCNRKSLTISRAQSPEVIQVIRVDIVLNKHQPLGYQGCNKDKLGGVNENYNISEVDKNKYRLTRSIKSLNEKLSNGDKVTLMCRTFRLSERFRQKCRRTLNTNASSSQN